MLLSCGVGEDSWESLGLQGNQSWTFIGRTDGEVEAPILWPPDAKNWLIRKDPDAGKDWSQEKGTTEDKIFGGHHWLDGHEFEQALGVGDGQGSPACCCPWGCKRSDMTERLNWTELIIIIQWFHTCEFTYSQKFVCNPQVGTHSHIHLQTCTEWQENWVTQQRTFPVKATQGDTLPSGFSSQTVLASMVLFMVYLVPCFWHFCVSIGNFEFQYLFIFGWGV